MRLDEFPNFAVEVSGRTRYLMKQTREKVRAFFIKYQDRIIYGTDISGGMIPTNFLIDMSKTGETWTNEEVEREKRKLVQRYLDDFRYYATDDEIVVRNYSIRGLALPKEVLYKVFYGNAVKWVPAE